MISRFRLDELETVKKKYEQFLNLTANHKVVLIEKSVKPATSQITNELRLLDDQILTIMFNNYSNAKDSIELINMNMIESLNNYVSDLTVVIQNLYKQIRTLESQTKNPAFSGNNYVTKRQAVPVPDDDDDEDKYVTVAQPVPEAPPMPNQPALTPLPMTPLPVPEPEQEEHEEGEIPKSKQIANINATKFKFLSDIEKQDAIRTAYLACPFGYRTSTRVYHKLQDMGIQISESSVKLHMRKLELPSDALNRKERERESRKDQAKTKTNTSNFEESEDQNQNSENAPASE